MKQFQREWSIATNLIHKTAAGALGSFMLQDAKQPNQVLTIAKWDCMSSWKAFWGQENPAEMINMHKLGERLSTTVYNELDDFTR